MKISHTHANMHAWTHTHIHTHTPIISVKVLIERAEKQIDLRGRVRKE